MRISLYSRDMAKIADVGTQYKSCLWQEQYNSKGSFVLELPATAQYKALARPDIIARRQGRNTLMVVKSVEVKETSIVLSGFMATALLYDTAFVGTVNENTPATNAIRTAYSKSSQLPHVSMGADSLKDTYKHQISNKSVYELAETICKECDIGFTAVKEKDLIKISFYKPPENKNAKFSRLIGNLNDQTLTLSNTAFKNYAIVLGQGEGKDRIRVDVDATAGKPRKEIIIDANDLQQEEGESLETYKKRLQARGAEKLLENAEIRECKVVINSADFGTRFDLGDIVTIALADYKLTLKARIVEFEQKAQNNGVTTKIKIGTPKMIKR